MSNTLSVWQSTQTLTRWALAGIAIALSACGQPDASQEGSEKLGTQERSLEASCTPTGLPTISPAAPLSIVLQCGDTWVAPEFTAVDSCGNPIPVRKYNTGDDDGDGVPGSVDPDDFGPGPDTTVEGIYPVQYLAWDAHYNITGFIIEVHVVNCP